MRTYLIPIAAVATALVVFLGLVEPPHVLKKASDIAASVHPGELKKETGLPVGDTKNARR
jgi:hypothetical protein